MTPRNDFVLVRRVKPDAVTAGGIHIPDLAQEKRMETRIEAIGPGAFLSTGVRCPAALADLHVGDRVIVSRYGGIAVEDNPDLYLVREQEIIMVLPLTGGSPAPKTKEKH